MQTLWWNYLCRLRQQCYIFFNYNSWLFFQALFTIMYKKIQTFYIAFLHYEILSFLPSIRQFCVSSKSSLILWQLTMSFCACVITRWPLTHMLGATHFLRFCLYSFVSMCKGLSFPCLLQVQTCELTFLEVFLTLHPPKSD